MRYIFIISGILLLFNSCSLFQKQDEIRQLSQKVDSLTIKVDELTEQNKALDEEFTWIENEFAKLNELKKSNMAAQVSSPAPKVIIKETRDWQCKAITNSGKRCSRPALEGSKYCWQHKKTYEPDKIDKPENKTSPTGSVSSDPEKK
jgi:outer membrane murein-binding lipoprotein Lpp